MVKKPFQSSNDYTIKNVRVTSDNGAIIDIANIVVQLEIFENLEKPYLTGRMMVRDDTDFIDGINFNGTERCTIVIEQPLTDGLSIEMNFILRKIDAVRKTNDHTEIVSISLLEENAFNSQLRKISKSYTGRPDEIIQKILEDSNLPLDMPTILPAQSGSMKYLVPNLNPMQAADTVKSRASTDNGMPFFLFKTMNEPNIKFQSLEEIMSVEPWNQNKPYRFSQAYTNHALNLTKEELAYIVEKFSYATKDDVLALVEAGAVSGSIDMIDLTSGVKETFPYNAEAMFQRLYEVGILNRGEIPVLSSKYSVDDLNLTNARAKNISRVIMNSTYIGNKNLLQEETSAQFKLDVTRRALKNLLFKNSISITVPGVHYLTGKNKSIGTQINFFYHNNNSSNIDKLSSEEELKDKKRSGKYVIYAARHLFVMNKHTVDLSAVKLGNEK